MNSLKLKILGLITMIVIVIVSGAAFINYQLQRKMVTSVTRSDSQMLAATVKTSVSNEMLMGHSGQIQSIVEKIGKQKQVRNLRIMNDDGVILASSEPSEVGGLPGTDEMSVIRNLKEMKSETLAHENESVYGTLSIIENSPACHRCHDPQKRVLGVLEVDLSLEHLNAFLSSGRNISGISAVCIVILIVIAISLFLIFYVDKPIRLLISSMEKVERGDFNAKTSITSSYEMHLLSENFNLMVDRLKELMDATVTQERDLVLAQESLAHHQEIHRMNQKLEEQLKEIEYLNISLEERIEDIEEANYKIADLAGELEDKNTTLEKAVGRLSTLYKVGLAINSTMEIRKLFHLIVTTTVSTLDAQIGYIILHDRERREMEVTTLVGFGDVEKPGTRIPMRASSASTWVIDNGKPLLVADINDTPQFDRFSALGYERKSLICAPLIIKDEVIGTITAVNKTNNTTYTPEELELLSTIAAQASIAIRNARLYEEQQKIYLNTIHALVSAIEASDSYTRGHSERVTRYSIELGQKLNLAPERLKVIERAAILHDIGKIGVDLTLLNKEGKLTPEDVNDLQQHPVIGMKILEPIEFLQDVRVCIGQHHERYDGLGYPNNVAADELLLESRILAIADSFDAMTSDRPYRKALPLEIAIRELVGNAGTQFDPELVPHFIEILERDDFFGEKLAVSNA
jgi:putative nucleotidyltransferase with HDIG domain